MKQQSHIWSTTPTQKKLYEIKGSNGSLVTAHTCTYEPQLIAYDSTQDAIWYSYYKPDTYEIAKISAKTGTAITTLNIGNEIHGLIYDSHNNIVWVSTGNDGKLYKVNASTGALVTSYNVGYYIKDLVYDVTNNIVWCLGNDRIRKFNVVAGTATSIGSFSSQPQRIILDSRQNAIWATSAFSAHTVYKYSISTGLLLGSYDSGSNNSYNGQGLCFDNDFNTIWVTKSNTSIRCLSAIDGAFIADYTVPTAAHTDLKYDPDTQAVWVLNEISVTKLNSFDGGVLGTYTLSASYPSTRLAISTFKNIDITGTVYTNSDKDFFYPDGLQLSLEINNTPRLVDKYGTTFDVTTTDGEFSFTNIDDIEVGDEVKVLFDDTQYNAEIIEEVDSGDSNIIDVELYPIMVASTISPSTLIKGASIVEVEITGENFGNAEGILKVGQAQVVVDSWDTHSITFKDQEVIIAGLLDIEIINEDIGSLVKTDYLTVRDLSNRNLRVTTPSTELGFKGLKYPLQLNSYGGLALSTTSTKPMDFSHIEESVLQILKTKFGERVMNYPFGTNVESLIFNPNDITLKTMIEYELREALTYWEPRITILELSITTTDNIATVSLVYTIIAYGITTNQKVYLGVL